MLLDLRRAVSSNGFSKGDMAMSPPHEEDGMAFPRQCGHVAMDGLLVQARLSADIV